MFTVTMMDNMVQVECDYVVIKRISCRNRKVAFGKYQYYVSMYSTMGMINNDSSIIN